MAFLSRELLEWNQLTSVYERELMEIVMADWLYKNGDIICWQDILSYIMANIV